MSAGLVDMHARRSAALTAITHPGPITSGPVHGHGPSRSHPATMTPATTLPRQRHGCNSVILSSRPAGQKGTGRLEVKLDFRPAGHEHYRAGPSTIGRAAGAAGRFYDRPRRVCGRPRIFPPRDHSHRFR